MFETTIQFPFGLVFGSHFHCQGRLGSFCLAAQITGKCCEASGVSKYHRCDHYLFILVQNQVMEELTLLGTNISPENGWLEYKPFFWETLSSGANC